MHLSVGRYAEEIESKVEKTILLIDCNWMSGLTYYSDIKFYYNAVQILHGFNKTNNVKPPWSIYQGNLKESAFGDKNNKNNVTLR